MRNEAGFVERQSTAAKVKHALLERARTMAPTGDPAFAERQAAAIARGECYWAAGRQGG